MEETGECAFVVNEFHQWFNESQSADQLDEISLSLQKHRRLKDGTIRMNISFSDDSSFTIVCSLGYPHGKDLLFDVRTTNERLKRDWLPKIKSYTSENRGQIKLPAVLSKCVEYHPLFAGGASSSNSTQVPSPVLKSERRYDHYLSLAPSCISLRYTAEEHRQLDVLVLRNFLRKFLDDSPVLHCNDDLKKEIYIYDKLLYKMNGPFRRHAHFQMAKRLQKLISRCFSKDVGRMKQSRAVVQQFVMSIRVEERDNVYCPSGEYFRLVLVHLRLLAEMLVKIAITSVEFCRRTMHMLDLGHFIQQHCLLLGVVARLRTHCCRRLCSLMEFFADFTSKGYLANGLRLKCADDASRDEGERFNRIFEKLSDAEAVLEQNRRVQPDTLSPLLRQQAVDYFENLFNVRLVEQQEKRRESGKGSRTRRPKEKPMQQMEFQQALAVKVSEPSPWAEEYCDMGVPVCRNADDYRQNSEKTQTAPVSTNLLELGGATAKQFRTVKAVKKLVASLEKTGDPKYSVALRFLKRKLVKMETFSQFGNRKKLKACLKVTHLKLMRLCQQ